MRTLSLTASSHLTLASLRQTGKGMSDQDIVSESTFKVTYVFALAGIVGYHRKCCANTV